MSWRIESSDNVAAPAEVVFAYYADPSTWGSWAHHTKRARTDGRLHRGSVVDVTDVFGRTWHVKVTDLVPGRRMSCVNMSMGFVIVSTYDAVPTETGCRIDHVIELGGRLHWLYRLVRPWYARLLVKETRTLAAIAGRGYPAGYQAAA